MGYKALLKKRDELKKKSDTMWAFVNAAREINEKAAKIKKAQDTLQETLARLHGEVQKIDAQGVAAFEAYKASLLAVCSGLGKLRTLPTKPLEAVAEAARKDVDQAYKAWVDKNSASFPKELRKGMTFVDKNKDTVYEIMSDLKPGDGDSFFEVTEERGGKVVLKKMSVKELTPQKGLKLVKA